MIRRAPGPEDKEEYYEEESEPDATLNLGLPRSRLELQRLLPPKEDVNEQLANPPPEERELIKGILHERTKMILAGTSKSNKTWCLVDLAICLASGRPFWGWECVKSKVLYINLELTRRQMYERRKAVALTRLGGATVPGKLDVWNLRGHSGDLKALRPLLQREGIEPKEYDVIMIDPIYKVLGNRNENSNGDIADLMNEVDALIDYSGAAVVFAHHFAKGNSMRKAPIDRMSGAGTYGRDADTVLIMTDARYGADCFRVTPILRSFPRQPEFLLNWEYPVMSRVEGAPANATQEVKGKGGRPRKWSDEQLLECIGEGGVTHKEVLATARKDLQISSSTMEKRLGQLVKGGLVRKVNSLYFPAIARED